MENWTIPLLKETSVIQLLLIRSIIIKPVFESIAVISRRQYCVGVFQGSGNRFSQEMDYDFFLARRALDNAIDMAGR